MQYNWPGFQPLEIKSGISNSVGQWSNSSLVAGAFFWTLGPSCKDFPPLSKNQSLAAVYFPSCMHGKHTHTRARTYTHKPCSACVSVGGFSLTFNLCKLKLGIRNMPDGSKSLLEKLPFITHKKKYFSCLHEAVLQAIWGGGKKSKLE